jgi:putative ABC transport system permease protein
MNVAWRKVWRDLARNKARTLLVVLSTAVGVFALGMVFGMSDVMHVRMAQVQRETKVAHITFSGGPFTQETVDAIGREPGVRDTQGELWTSLRWKPVAEGKWRDANLIVRAEYDAQRMEFLRLLDGSWPEGRALGVERMASRYFDLPPGSAVLFEFGERERHVRVDGVMRMHMIFPPQWGGYATFFAMPEAADWLLGQEVDFNRLQVRLESFSQEGAEEAAERIDDRLKRMGLSVSRYEITDPDVHWLQDMIDGVLLVLVVLGILSLGLSAFLIINTMNAIIAQQVWQIGVMKAVGATLGSLLRVYLATALIYGVLALLLAVPLGIVGAYGMAVWMLDLLNVALDSFDVSIAALVLQVAVGLVVPLLAALVPVLGGARTTAREAISTHGIGSGFGQGLLDRLLGQVRRLPRPLALSLRNTFRHKARVALTLLTLALGGVMFIMTMSVGDSFSKTVDLIFDQLGEDVSLTFDRPHRVERLRSIAGGVSGIRQVEVWNDGWATLPVESGEELPVNLRGVPAGSAMFNPQLAKGRTLIPGDGRAVIINDKLADEEGIGVGDEIVMELGGEEAVWTVVGIALSTSSNSNDFFVPFDTLARGTGTEGRGTEVKVVCGSGDRAFQQQLIAALREAYAANRMEVVSTWCTSEGRAQNQASFGTIIYLLLSMALLAAAVGGIGLASTMSINVVERRREIGVMRAVGASSSAIAGIFVAEGIFLGALSLLVALPVSVPGSRVFSDVLGTAVISLPLAFTYSVDGVLLWLAIVVGISALASLWPALRATRVSVRESLAYE